MFTYLTDQLRTGDIAVDGPSVAAQRGHAEAVVLGAPADESVGCQGQAPHLFILLLMVAADGALTGIREGAAQRLQILALVQLPGDPASVRLVGEVAGGVQGAGTTPRTP